MKRRIAVPVALGLAALPTVVGANSERATARAAVALFAEHCFSPFLTAQKAQRIFALSGTQFDFYDLDPLADTAPSHSQTAVTPGTDRRCEISFAGNYAEKAAEAARQALADEGILTLADLPETYRPAPGTTLLAARQLNPRRVAVVHVGTRAGPLGPETFLLVERLKPTNPPDQ